MTAADILYKVSLSAKARMKKATKKKKEENIPGTGVVCKREGLSQ